MSYGEPLTNIGQANVPLLKPETAEAMMTVAPMAGPAARGAGRLVGSQINRAMLGEGGLLAPITPQPMFAAPQNIARKNNLTPSLQIEDKVLPVTMHKLEEKAGNQIVNINPEAFDKAFSKTDWQYVGKGGEGGIEGRYKGFENWLKDAKSMTASNVSVNKDGGVVFGDGRHRYAVLRDMGLDKLPISMDKESIKNAKKFGYIADESSLQYPLAPAGTRYEEFAGNLTYMTPDEFLQKVRPLKLDDESLDNIAALKRHIESGGKLDPLHIYSTGKEDGRHRAYLAKELGIEKVPVALHEQPIQGLLSP
jgi:hypothetical protein